ncbi:MAG: purine-nucleoside phosphorylase [Ignavibacteria bacterium]
MTKQKQQILESVKYIKQFFPSRFSPEVAIIGETDYKLQTNFKVLKQISFNNIPPRFNYNYIADNRILCLCRHKTRDFIVINGRLHYYEGISMRDIGHWIYVLKFLGVRTIFSVEDVATLNPRYKCGELALIYDHINFMGNNPLIGENDDELGVRFPDMSNAYDNRKFALIYSFLQEQKIKINESVYIGLIGPASETAAEARFYREIGADVVGYSIIPENIVSVHSNVKFAAIGLIVRELIADKMMENESAELLDADSTIKNRKKALKTLKDILNKLIEIL